MPPKPTPNPKSKPNPLTTAGRLAKAAQKRDREMAAATPPTPPPPKKKPRKTPIMPPPCEIEAEAALREEAKKAKKNKPKKPLTTKDKLAAASAAKVRKQQAEMEAAVGGVKRAKGNFRAEKPRNLMDIMRELGQMGAKGKSPASSKDAGKGKVAAPKSRGDGPKAKEKESVLPQSKENAKRVIGREEHQLQDKTKNESTPSPASVKIEDVADDQPRMSSRLMELPPELRQRIWYLTVVETKKFIYPTMSSEQPDLAMTSRQIRSEVLPIYYGENTFAIDIAPLSTRSNIRMTDSMLPRALELVDKWAAELGNAGHIQTIRKWALSWFPSLENVSDGLCKIFCEEAIISVQYPKPEVKGPQDVRPEVVIHQQKSCLLECHSKVAQCANVCHLEWMNDIIDTADREAERNRGKQVIQIALALRLQGGKFMASRCEEEIAKPK